MECDLAGERGVTSHSEISTNDFDKGTNTCMYLFLIYICVCKIGPEQKDCRDSRNRKSAHKARCKYVYVHTSIFVY